MQAVNDLLTESDYLLIVWLSGLILRSDIRVD